MKYISSIFILVICLYSPLTRAKVELITSPNPPWITITDNVISGSFIKKVKMIFNELNIPFEISTSPWKRCIRRMERGTSDALLMLLKTKKREETMSFTIPLAQDYMYLYFKKETPIIWNSFEDLKNIKIAKIRGYSYGKDVDAFFKSYRPIEVDSELQLIRMLQMGKIDAGFFNKMTVDIYNKKQNIKNKLIHGSKFVEHDLYSIGFSKKLKYLFLIPKINQIIKNKKLLKSYL